MKINRVYLITLVASLLVFLHLFGTLPNLEELIKKLPPEDLSDPRNFLSTNSPGYLVNLSNSNLTFVTDVLYEGECTDLLLWNVRFSLSYGREMLFYTLAVLFVISMATLALAFLDTDIPASEFMELLYSPPESKKILLIAMVSFFLINPMRRVYSVGYMVFLTLFIVSQSPFKLLLTTFSDKKKPGIAMGVLDGLLLSSFTALMGGKPMADVVMWITIVNTLFFLVKLPYVTGILEWSGQALKVRLIPEVLALLAILLVILLLGGIQ